MVMQVYVSLSCVSLPPNEKVHQIIVRTAMFVCKHGGQSEIILRVKQGDNPTFGFLMPDHYLHPYFRFLVDHQEFLKPDIDDGNSSVEKNRTQGPNQTGGALSLLGSVYGSGEDEDDATDDTLKFKRNECEENAVAVISTSTSQETEQAESCRDAAKKDGGISKNPLSSLKEKVPVIKRNQSVSTVKSATTARTKRGDPVVLLSDDVDSSQPSLPSIAKSELPVVEPPFDLKRVIEKIVEFILRNGKEFEGVLAEQDRAHGRFPFLLPSNQYHPYYLKVLQNFKEPKLRKHDLVGRAGDKRSLHKDGDNLSVGSMGSDLPNDTDRKEKFKMVIGRTKKDEQESTSKDTQPQVGVTMDAAAAAAILQAATRGIKNPNIEIFTKTSSGNGQGPGSDGGHLSSFGSLHSSQPQGPVQKPKQNTEANVSVPVAKVIAETAAIAAAGEADSSEACMTKEEKLKAERLKRARMFAAMIKGGAAPLKSEPLRSLSVEPLGSGISGSGAETGNLVGKEREGSSVPFQVNNSDKSDEPEEIPVDNNKQRSKRSYRSRSSRHEEQAEEKEEEESEEDKRDHKRSRKKHHAHRSSHHSRERHKHKRRHSFSKDGDSAKGTKHVSSSDDEPQYLRHHRKYDSSSDEKRHYSRRLHRESSLSDTEHRHSHHWRKRHNSSGDERQKQRRSVKHQRRSDGERETDLEEGEIIMKSDHSKASDGGGASREASVELSKSNNNVKAPSQPSESTEVSNELRAKIRAMLMATL